MAKANKELFGGTRGEGAKRPSLDKVSAMSAEELQEAVDTLEKEMNELRAQYELYFMGVERLEPVIARDNVRSKLRRLREVQTTNTSLKFKIQMLQARIVSLESYWGRINRQREAGTYKRDLDKVKRREAELAAEAAKKAKAAEVAAGHAPETDIAATSSAAPAPPEGSPVSAGDGRSSAPSRTPAGHTAPPRPGSVARPTASSAEDLTDPSLRQLYQTYVTAKRRCGEQIDLRFDEMAASLRKQVPKLIKSTGAKAIEFKVVIKGGHAVLKAVPKT
ncbi:MAG: hypothetical protein IT384_24510 [Deltaproteobacteria bacterium]|nr:hypothetical protein [Deltaproteobacteria bacterium]